MDSISFMENWTLPQHKIIYHRKKDGVFMRLQGAIFDFETTLLDNEGQPRPGVKSFLSLMKMEDVWMYLMTDGDRVPVREAVEQSGLDGYFRGIMAAPEHRSTITDPELYEKTVRRLRTARRATVIFTGRESVLRVAKAAGFQVVLVQEAPEAEERALADEVIRDYREMLRSN